MYICLMVLQAVKSKVKEPGLAAGHNMVECVRAEEHMGRKAKGGHLTFIKISQKTNPLLRKDKYCDQSQGQSPQDLSPSYVRTPPNSDILEIEFPKQSLWGTILTTAQGESQSSEIAK